MNYFLCGQTGNVNRGCEAIIRSTVKLLNQSNDHIYLATFAPEQDRKMATELGINVIPYRGYPGRIQRYGCSLIKRINRKSLIGTKYFSADLYSYIKSGDISLSIGGDTYCYGDPPRHYPALNKYALKHGIHNIFWCCSVEKESIKGEIKKDINRYKYIFAREQITYENLIAQGIPKEKVIKVCDPAFFLDKKQVDLPIGFVENNTVGINVSECVITDNKENIVYNNVIHLINYILNETDMSVCLIPHVYNIEKNICDWPILNRIREDVNNPRVSLVDKEYDCEQLKYIISKCRFLVCARTHASIAAYSSEVPTLVLGYSVKSKGIATDLFGTDKNYVIPYTELTEKQELTSAFRYIETHEEKIRNKLHSILPSYKEQLSQAIKKYIVSENEPSALCDPKLCTGCGTCTSVCPVHSISMEPDDEGFLRPHIDSHSCINCGKCRDICPIVNRYHDDGKEPLICAAVNINEQIKATSSSGGVFSALAEKIIVDGGVVFGATFNEQFNVVHSYAQSLVELEKFRGSKYVQSETGDSYIKAKSFLEAGKKVLFTGTPCQISGLYAYLQKNYDNLITQDIICHGVPSPMIWNKYLDHLKRIHKSDITRITFRDKRESWKKYSVRFNFENQNEYCDLASNNFYMQSFLLHYCLRPSCHICAFKNLHRQSDITLADCWGIEHIQPEKNDDKGISLIMMHSEKGKNLVNQCSTHLITWDYDLNIALKHNSSMLSSSQSSLLRHSYMNDARHYPINKLSKKYCGTGAFARLQRFVLKFK